jgi:tight adherence protein C
MMTLLLYPTLTVATVALFIYAARLYTTPGVGAILVEQARPPEPPKKPAFERYVLPLVRRFVVGYQFAIPFVNRRTIRQKLAWAGDPYGLRVNDVVQLKVGSIYLAIPLALYCGLFLSLPTTTIVLIAVCSALPCFFIPDIWLHDKAKERQEEITRQLPDFIDLLAISIAAGVGFDLAVNNIVVRMRGPLAQELERMVQELRMGKPRRFTYRKMIWRNDSLALRAMFTAMIQADELGTPVADIMEWQAQTLRHQRIQEARRRGAQASAKVSLVLSTILLFSLTFLILATMGLNLFLNGGLPGQ